MKDIEIVDIDDIDSLTRLERQRSLHGKNVLITLAISSSSTREAVLKSVSEALRVHTGRKDKDTERQIKTAVNDLIALLREWEDLPSDGCVLFVGPTRDPGGLSTIHLYTTLSFIDGYENFARPHFDNKFHVGPLLDRYRNEAISRTKEKNNLGVHYLREIQSELAKPDPKVEFGCSHVIEALRSENVNIVIVSDSITEVTRCLKCGIVTPIASEECDYCYESIDTDGASLHDEINGLCEGLGVDLICFEKNAFLDLEDSYYSVVCFRKY